MQVLCTLGIKMLFFLSICRFGELQFLKPAYNQKIKKIDSEKSPSLHILKKIKKKQKFQTLCGTDWHR